MKIWKDFEVKELFDAVEVCKNNKQALKLAFSSHAKKYKRQPNSVRNYYYQEVENLKKDEKRCKKLEISIEKHEKTHFVGFDEDGEKKLLDEITKLTSQGISVRAACRKLSDGDLALMTRLQNKYQNSKKKVEKVDNVIPFRQKQKLLTEADINSLFMGLVKLIKKTAIEDFMEKTRVEKESSNFLLKKAFLDLNKKDKQIAELRAEFETLKNENKVLISKLETGLDKKEALKLHLISKIEEKSLENKKV